MEQYKPLAHMRRVGLLGGTFDPIHYGHLAMAEEVYAALDLAEIIFIPTGHPPHKASRTIAPAAHRLAMLERAMASNLHFSLSSVDIQRPGPSYTADTLRLLRKEWSKDTAFYFIIGWDSLEELPTWYEPKAILEQLEYLVAISRPGYAETPGYREELEQRLPGLKERLLVVPGPQLAISSTELRQRVAEHRPIRYQLPEAVEQYIEQHGLYRET